MAPDIALADPNAPSSLVDNITGFMQHLRLNGFKLGPAETRATLTAILAKTTGVKDVDRNRMKALLVGCKEEWDQFDELFSSYWFTRGRVKNRMQKPDISKRSTNRPPGIWRDHFGGDDGDEKAPQIECKSGAELGQHASGRLVATDRKSRERTDLRHFVDPVEIAEVEALALKLARAIRYRLSRRYKNSKNNARLDMRRTIRASLKHGGTPIDLRFKATPPQPVRIIVFLDVSGSMKHYSRFFLQFVKGLVCQWTQTDAYIFHTRLVRVTDAMRDPNALRAMTRLSLMADGLGGGTKLGDCLEVFNRQYAKKTLNSRSIVMIFSDGYEVGTPENLCAQVKIIKKRARRLVWLNPLLGWQNYEPVTAAMSAVLPYIDHFSAANTLQSLAAIEPDLARL